MTNGSFKWAAAAVSLAAAVLLGVACGSESNNTTSGSSNNNETCTFGGEKCAAGCSDVLGCIECDADSMCPAGAPLCVLGRCEECKSSTDCGTGKVCYPRDWKCEAACAADGDCPGESPLCEPMTNTCLGCLTNADCKDSGKPVCDPTRHQCGECAANADCGIAQPICDLQNGECRECLVDAHCPAGTLCGTDAKCHSACTTNVDCKDPAKPVCDVGANDCVECLSNMDCGAAEPFCDGKNCRVCVVNADCPISTPLCKDKNTCVECLSNNDCKDPLAAICKGEQCIQCDKDEHCTFDPLKTKCQNQICVAP